MTRQRRRIPVGVLYFTLWLVQKCTRIRSFQFDKFSHFHSRSDRRSWPQTVEDVGDDTRAVPRLWDRFSRLKLHSGVSSTSQADGTDSCLPSLAPPVQVVGDGGSQAPHHQPPPTSDANGAAASRTYQTPPASSSSSSSPAFYDQAILHVRAGSGGSGATTFELLSNNNKGGSRTRGKQQQGAPNGGPGGRGGNVVLQVDPDLNTLAGLAARQGKNSAGGALVLRAENGMDGQTRKRSGAPGRDVIVRVPPGTIVEELIMNQDDDSESEEGEWVELGRLALVDHARDNDTIGPDDSQLQGPSTLIIGRGGRGGDGNFVYANAAASRRRGSPKSAVRRDGPTAGERKVVRLTLQFLADVAIVGMPNAGKSTFLAAVTRAKPKIANYAFTTIIPNLGVWINEEDDGTAIESASGIELMRKLVLCDVPGLVQGASQGVGLGHEFLRHVERCSVLVHLVDGTSPNAVDDYQMINRELAQYAGGMLASKPQVVIVNKLDLLSDVNKDEPSPATSNRLELQQALLEVMPHSRLLWMSAKEKQGVDQVMQKVASFVQKVNQPAAAAAINADTESK